ncbi:MAG: histone deacetylase family protein [Geminicoccaceae bacterium]|nr:MAG: histone deacetylase family protein [Geminicoccaceae bacterium]
MRTAFSPHHVERNPKTELSGGQLVTPFESPRRAELIKAAIETARLGPVLKAQAFDLEPVLRVHDAGFVAFLETVWQRWQAAGMAGEAIPTVFPARRMQARPVRNIEGQLGYYAMAVETAIDAGTYPAALGAKDAALTAAQWIALGDRCSFALCRPPGHHAAFDLYGGYCFLNNAAIAAQHLLDHGASRIAVLDVDFHHGNGTQDIFYRRDDVLFLSLHGDPQDAFPHFSGFADETGEGKGLGFTANYPLPPGTGWERWAEALEHALARVVHYAPDVLVVSLGVDTFERDPISFFRLRHPDFRRLGGRLGELGTPTLYVMEGGYAIDDIGQNVVAVLAGHLDR